MKKIRLETLAVLLMFGVLFAMSCKKKEDTTTPTTPQTTKDKLTGSWEQTKRAKDDNSNGTMEESEKYDLDAGDAYSVDFNADGTGVLHIKDSSGGADTSLPMTWELKNNDEDIYVIIPAFDDSSISGLTTVTGTDLVLWDNKDEPTDPKEWSIFVKK